MLEKYFKVILTVALQCLLIVNCTNGLPSKPTSSDTPSVFEVNKVLNDFDERSRLYHLIDQVSYKKPLVVPSCPQYLYYDAKEKVCSETYKRAHCGKNMEFLSVPNTTDFLGACACSNVASLLRWGRPQALTGNNQCADIGSRGPCNAGEVMVPIKKLQAACGVDACTGKKPENAINFSTGSKERPSQYPIFKFTYKGKCFKTESEGFCSTGQVVRFILPYKTPTCVDRNEVEEQPIPIAPLGNWPVLGGNNWGGSVSGAAPPLECDLGFVANPNTGLCQRTPSFDFV